MAYRGAPRQKKEASEKGQHFPFRVKKRLVESYKSMELPQKREIKKEVRIAFTKAIIKNRAKHPQLIADELNAFREGFFREQDNEDIRQQAEIEELNKII